MRQNEDMRKISAYVAIAAVPTLIAGIYGMNFEHMPELSWEAGYPMALVLMASIVGFLFWRFKRAGWLGSTAARAWRTTASSARSWRASCPRRPSRRTSTRSRSWTSTRGRAGTPSWCRAGTRRNLYEVDDADLGHAAAAARRLALRMRDALGCDGVNLLNCCEPAAWQTVFHTHIHVIPRYDDDPLQLPVRPRQAEQDELAAVAAQLRTG